MAPIAIHAIGSARLESSRGRRSAHQRRSRRPRHPVRRFERGSATRAGAPLRRALRRGGRERPRAGARARPVEALRRRDRSASRRQKPTARPAATASNRRVRSVDPRLSHRERPNTSVSMAMISASAALDRQLALEARAVEQDRLLRQPGRRAPDPSVRRVAMRAGGAVAAIDFLRRRGGRFDRRAFTERERDTVRIAAATPPPVLTSTASHGSVARGKRQRRPPVSKSALGSVRWPTRAKRARASASRAERVGGRDWPVMAGIFARGSTSALGHGGSSTRRKRRADAIEFVGLDRT